MGKGDHQLKRGNGESGIFLVNVKYAGSSGISSAAVNRAVTSTEYFTLQGQRIIHPRHGACIEVSVMADGTRHSRTVIYD